MASFCYYCRLSSAQLDRWQAPMQRPIIDQCLVEQTAYRRDQRPHDNGYKSFFTISFLAGMSKEQVLDKGIRQKSTKRVNSFIVCSAFCPGPPSRDPMGSSGSTMAHHVWHVDKAPGHTRKNQNACLKVLRLSMVEQTAYRREIKDNGYKSIFTNSWLVRQRNRSWIKG